MHISASNRNTSHLCWQHLWICIILTHKNMFPARKTKQLFILESLCILPLAVTNKITSLKFCQLGWFWYLVWPKNCVEITPERFLTVILGNLRPAFTPHNEIVWAYYTSPESSLSLESIPVFCFVSLTFLDATGLKDSVWFRQNLCKNVCDQWFEQPWGPLYLSELLTTGNEWKLRVSPLKWHQTQ